jgi:hypothetical protein
MTWTRDWARNKDDTPWDLEDIFGTVEYAARRILALLPRRDGDQDATTREIVARMSPETWESYDRHDRYRMRTESMRRQDGELDATTRTLVARMSHATRKLHFIHDRYRMRTESSGPTKLETMAELEKNLEAIERLSGEVFSRGHVVFAPERQHEWSGVFQQFQNIISVALRHLGDKIVETHFPSTDYNTPYS